MRELIKPIVQAQDAMELFRAFVKADLPPELKNLDQLIRKTDYKCLYEQFKAKELIIPAPIWSEVSGKASKEGLKGLIDV